VWARRYFGDPVTKTNRTERTMIDVRGRRWDWVNNKRLELAVSPHGVYILPSMGSSLKTFNPFIVSSRNLA